ncbi:SDR family oxidoreductase [Clostridium sp. DL1XJH146]
MSHVIITGSTRGIGYGLAQNFLKRGYNVTVNGRTSAKVEETVINLKKEFPKQTILGFAGSVSNMDDINKLWDETFKITGRIDIWINNAGVDQKKALIYELNSEDIKKVIDTNILGVINGSSVAMKNMLKQGAGEIYNMEGYGSNNMMMPKMTLYGTSKRALRYFTKSLTKEAENTSIKVGRLSPGMVVTDFLINSLSGTEEEKVKTKKVFNILADKVETVTEFLVEGIIKNDKNDAYIAWLTKGKSFRRFMLAPFNNRELFKE